MGKLTVNLWPSIQWLCNKSPGGIAASLQRHVERSWTEIPPSQNLSQARQALVTSHWVGLIDKFWVDLAFDRWKLEKKTRKPCLWPLKIGCSSYFDLWISHIYIIYISGKRSPKCLKTMFYHIICAILSVVLAMKNCVIRLHATVFKGMLNDL